MWEFLLERRRRDEKRKKGENHILVTFPNPATKLQQIFRKPPLKGFSLAHQSERSWFTQLQPPEEDLVGE